MNTNETVTVQTSEASWKLGDRVVLTSGGPILEVVGFSRNRNVWCEWKDADGFIEEGSFAPTSLEPA